MRVPQVRMPGGRRVFRYCFLNGTIGMLAYERLLIIMLRLFGGVTCLALLATLMPTGWMAATHVWLGLGPFPRAPLTEYLTRSIAGLYAIHGGAILLVSSDVRRFAPVIAYLAVVDGLFGFVLIAIDVYAGLPSYWTAIEGPSVMVTGAIVLWLQSCARTTQQTKALSTNSNS